MFCSHSNVFISHSSANKEIVEQLSSYIEKLGVEPDHIFCSSVVSQGIDNGEKLGKAISEAIGKSRVLVFLLSRDFVSSVYCMQELGVGWHLSEQGKAKCFCLVLPDISISDIDGFINSRVIKFSFVDEDHKGEFGLFAENLCKELHINPHAGAAPAQIVMKTEAAKFPVFWYNVFERDTLQSAVGRVARNSYAAKAV